MANEILARLSDEEEAHLPAGPVKQLVGIERKVTLGTMRSYNTRPTTPLSEAALLTNSHGEPSLGAELRAELVSADAVDLLCAFVMWPGIRLLESELRTLRAHNVPIRVICSTYTGCTDRRTLDRLVDEFGAQVKVHYEIQRTRLHAKAWLFRRDTGFHTGYVGSSNLSSSALLEGVEWNVRISEVATPTLMRKFDATFESYWNDPAFETYLPERDAERLDMALAKAGNRAPLDDSISLSGLAVSPLPHQKLILEQLEAERVVHDRHRNLVVAATGTGKTVIAALDYLRLCHGDTRPTLLFVAHRREILEQARRTFREVLNDGAFGELWVDGKRPTLGAHIFASVQSLARLNLEDADPAAYDVVVVDEFHHAEAPSYRRLVELFEPQELLGLTATPERADGVNVADFFGGRIAAELRLWDALEADLLTPFHYFAVGDTVDLRHVKWARGSYDQAELENLYASNEARARHVLRAVRDKVGDLAQMKAIGFCVSQEHARFMARRFSDAGVPSVAVISGAESFDRSEAVRRLVRGEVKAIFTVDMFNEGIDIPAVNTVIFLRPTKSATVFVQQLGRGLRLANNKPVLTALDFVGHQRAEYRLDRKLRAIAKRMTRAELRESVNRGFDSPGGSQIVLDDVARSAVLENIRAGISSSWKSMTAELRTSPIAGLREFLDDSGLELSDILRNNKSWTTLRRDAGADIPPPGPRERQLAKRVRALVHVNDRRRHAAYSELLSDGFDWLTCSADARHFAPLLAMSLWPDGGGFVSVVDAIKALSAEPAIRSELIEVLDLALDRVRWTSRVETEFSRTAPTLALHGRYTREELLTAIGYSSFERRNFPKNAVAGVYRVDERRLDALLVTTVKTDSGFSPTTMYRDYAISPSRFHWESQSTTRAASSTGQRYISHAASDDTILLFAREHIVTEFGSGAPYVFLGTAKYLHHQGERPMAVTWQLDESMPEGVFEWARTV
ncbi:DUF3427 domain-containing protein [Calidifontibacter terrae]